MPTTTKKTKTKKAPTTLALEKVPKIIRRSKSHSKDPGEYPLKYYSSSSLKLFSTNPILFKIKYLNGDVFETTQNISGVLGSAFHRAMEVYYGGAEDIIVSNEAEAIEWGLKAGMDYLEKYNDGFINYSKTIDNKQAALEKLAFAFNAYVHEKPYENGEEIVSCEQDITESIDVVWRGVELHLPIKLRGRLDKVVRVDGKLKVVDYKTCYAFSDLEKIDGAKILQAVIYYLLAYQEYGEEPYSIIFEEVKYTKNKDGSPQVKHYEMVFSEHDLYFDFFFRYYDDVTRGINGEMVYLPNLDAFYDNEVAIIAYIHHLDIPDETAKLAKKHKVKTLNDLLKLQIQSAGNMRKLLKAVEDRLTTAKSIDYEKMENQEKIQTKMLEHGMVLQFHSKLEGATVDLYRYTPTIGLKMSKLRGYAEDIEQILGMPGVRVLAPIPGTSFVGFEVPRKERRFPMAPPTDPADFMIAVGEMTTGDPFLMDFREWPHLLAAGSSGAGKSVALNSLISQFIKKENIELHLFDPKKVELNHFQKQVIEYQDDPTAIAAALERLVKEMYDRYEKMKAAGVKNITGMPGMKYRVIVIDEFAELTMRGNVGASIQSIAQLGRAAGFHIIIATQRASTKVISGDIKVNFPTKMVFRMSKATDSMVMIDEAGAEKLLGKGDMIFASDAGQMRLQGYNV